MSKGKISSTFRVAKNRCSGHSNFCAYKLATQSSAAVLRCRMTMNVPGASTHARVDHWAAVAHGRKHTLPAAPSRLVACVAHHDDPKGAHALRHQCIALHALSRPCCAADAVLPPLRARVHLPPKQSQCTLPARSAQKCRWALRSLHARPGAEPGGTEASALWPSSSLHARAGTCRLLPQTSIDRCMTAACRHKKESCCHVTKCACCARVPDPWLSSDLGSTSRPPHNA
jgi:hypothetical protein